MEITIREETQNDYETVYDLIKEAFGSENEAQLVEALRQNSQVFVPSLSLVACFDNQIVGHILLSKIKILDNRHNEFESLALAPVSVKPNFQRKGIGKKMILQSIEKAKTINFTSIIVLGHAEYYPKFGFVPALKWNITSRYNVPSNVFMALELCENGLKNISGTVIYPKEFDVF